MTFIAPERKRALVKGTGIQYIPGHIDPFIDFVIDNCLPCYGSILDIGGGGLRFAIPVASKGINLTVVDADPDSINVDYIIDQVIRVGKLELTRENIRPKITAVNSDAFSFLQKSDKSYSLVTSFRYLHFLSPDELNNFFKLVNKRIPHGGIFAFSAMTPYDVNNYPATNELYDNSEPLVPGNDLFRKFNNSFIARNICSEQNLGDTFHMIDNSLVVKLAETHGLSVINEFHPSTRIVAGYVLRKSNFHENTI